MSTVKPFREALIAALSAALEIPFVSGPVSESQEDQDLGCVWLEGNRPMAADGNNEELIYGVRVFRFWRQSQGDDADGRNVENLENDVEALQVALRAVLTSAGHDFFNVGGVSVNYELQYVEASLVAYQRNLGARGG